MDGVQVVVHRDAADAHRVGDVLDGSAQDERTPLVEQPHGALLVLRDSIGRRPPSSASTASINRSSAPCSGGRRTAAIVRPSQTIGTSLASVAARHERGADRVDDRPHRRMSGSTGRSAPGRSLRHPAESGHAGGAVGASRATWTLTWVAPCPNAASVTAATSAPTPSTRRRTTIRTGPCRHRRRVDGPRRWQQHVRAGSALDERLDREFDVDHARQRRCVGSIARHTPVPITRRSSSARTTQSAPASPNASLSLPSACLKLPFHSSANRSRAGPCHVVPFRARVDESPSPA